MSSPVKWISKLVRYRVNYHSDDLTNFMFVLVDLEKNQSISMTLAQLKELLR